MKSSSQWRHLHVMVWIADKFFVTLLGGAGTKKTHKIEDKMFIFTKLSGLIKNNIYFINTRFFVMNLSCEKVFWVNYPKNLVFWVIRLTVVTCITRFSAPPPKNPDFPQVPQDRWGWEVGIRNTQNTHLRRELNRRKMS